MFLSGWQRWLRLYSRSRNRVKSAQRPRHSRRPQVERLEDRTVPSTILWTNRGSFDPLGMPSTDPLYDKDGFNAVFGPNANLARQDVDAAIRAWENVIVSFN